MNIGIYRENKSNNVFANMKYLLSFLNFNISVSLKGLFSLSTGAKKKIIIFENNVMRIMHVLLFKKSKKVIIVRNERKISCVNMKQAN